MVMSQVCDLRMRMNEKKKIGIEYEMAYVYNVYVSLQMITMEALNIHVCFFRP